MGSNFRTPFFITTFFFLFLFLFSGYKIKKKNVKINFQNVEKPTLYIGKEYAIPLDIL